MTADLATFVGAGPAFEWRCPLCPRTAGQMTRTQARQAGWRLRDEGTVVACPYCWDNPLIPESDGRLLPTVGWDARCHTCDAAASAGVRYGMTRDEAQQWIDDHECEPDVWLIEPEEEK